MNSSSIVAASDAGALRERLHGMWSSVAGGWSAHAEFVEQRGALVTRTMLELACGTGATGLAAADVVGAEGEVVLSDIAPEMVAIAAGTAEARGLTQVRTRVLDLEDVDAADESFDVVLCREGLMLVPDPERAAREMQRVLRPGGRSAVAVWGPRGRNPWLGLVFDTVSAELGAPMPPPGVPGPFSLDDASRLEAILAGAGFEEVSVREVPTPYRAGSADEWWARTCDLAGPLAQKLAALPEPKKQQLRERAVEAVRGYATGNGLELPGVTLVAGGVRAQS